MRVLLFILIFSSLVFSATLAQVSQFEVLELSFTGPMQTPNDNPMIDIEFYVDFKHMSGEIVRVHGFWDGDGNGGTTGNVFKIRFCPYLSGSWILDDVSSNVPELKDQQEDNLIIVSESDHPGFWLIDEYAPTLRWFKRSNGSHHYIIGNTHYDFLGAPNGVPATRQSIEADIAGNFKYFKKLRFCVRGFRPENADPNLKPFFKDGEMTELETHRPNPQFFSERVDVAVQKGYELDLICDLILGGTTGDQVADSLGFLKYIAARYGAYPNVWFCTGQEWNEQTDAAHEVRIGSLLRSLSPFPNPISTHATEQFAWNNELWGDWNSHSIRQGKLPLHFADLQSCAQAMMTDYENNQGRPTVNDENGYDPNEGSEIDVLEGILGTFAGGGYGTSGHKLDSKQGAYYWGYSAQGLTVDDHPSADNLGWLREKIDANIDYWRMQPRIEGETVVLEWPQVQKVVFSNKELSLSENLQDGPWKVVQFDVVDKIETVLSESAQGDFIFSTPNSRAVMTFFENLNPVGVKQQSVPQEFVLQQNYPNPFNPVTTISYSLNKSAHVHLEVLNVRGQQVATLVDAYQAAGVQSVTFDAADLSSGLYFYQIVFDGSIRQAKKMLLTK